MQLNLIFSSAVLCNYYEVTCKSQAHTPLCTVEDGSSLTLCLARWSPHMKRLRHMGQGPLTALPLTSDGLLTCWNTDTEVETEAFLNFSPTRVDRGSLFVFLTMIRSHLCHLFAYDADFWSLCKMSRKVPVCVLMWVLGRDSLK